MSDGGADSRRALIECDVTDLVRRVMGDAAQRDVEPDVEFRSLGLDSQSIVALIATAEQHFGIQFGLDTPPEAFTSIARLSDAVLTLRTSS